MDLKKRFLTDKKAEIEGIWVDLDDARIKVARYENPHYLEALRKKSGPYRAAARAGVMRDEDAERVLNEVMAETILLDWEGLKEDGQEIPYSRQNALRILSEYRDFRDVVLSFAKDLELYKLQVDEADEKNLSTSSAGI